MQCMKYSKIWLNLTFATLNLTFIRGQKAFPVLHADRVIIRLPACGQGQLFRIRKVQCLAKLGKGMLSSVEQAFVGMDENRLYFLCLKSGKNSLYSRCFPKWIDTCSYGMLWVSRCTELLILLFGPGIFSEVDEDSEISQRQLQEHPEWTRHEWTADRFVYPLHSIPEWYYILVTMY